MCSLDPFPGNDVLGESVLVEANSPCISCATSTGAESFHGGSVLDLKRSGSVGQDLGCLSTCWYSPLSDALYSSTLKTGSLTVHIHEHTLVITEV